MNRVLMLAQRNALCYFRDRTSVVFSFVTALIVVALYILFLRNYLINSMYMGDWDFVSVEQVPALIDSWVMAGIIGIVSVSSCVQALQVMVDDRATGKDMDINSAPVSPAEVSAGYILSAFYAGMVISGTTFVVALLFLCATGCILDPFDILACALLLVPMNLAAAIVLFALASFLKSQGAFTGFSVVMSTFIGLLFGIYLPMANFPGFVLFLGNLVPATHMAALFRQHLCSGPMDAVLTPEEASEFRKEMGIDIYLGDFQFDLASSLLYTVAFTALFFIIAVAIVKMKRARRPWRMAPSSPETARWAVFCPIPWIIGRT